MIEIASESLLEPVFRVGSRIDRLVTSGTQADEVGEGITMATKPTTLPGSWIGAGNQSAALLHM